MTTSAPPNGHLRAAPAPARPQLSIVETRAGRIDLNVSAVIVASIADVPSVLVLAGDTAARLPSGPIQPAAEVSLEDDLRMAVDAATGLALGYVEQLCTLAHPTAAEHGAAPALGVCVSYLALTRPGTDGGEAGVVWSPWYAHFPWEDWRHGKPRVLAETIEPAIMKWAGEAPAGGDAHGGPALIDRVRQAFGIASAWDEERVGERYELLAAAGLLERAQLQGNGRRVPTAAPLLDGEHARRLAIAIGRLRAKIKYRPVVFELMPEEFTLFEFQRAVEAVLGTHLHKQNFRRLVEGTGLVEATGEIKMHTGGRPAKLVRFRRDVLMERAAPGVRVKAARLAS